jgi:hypothetical protein
MLHHEKAARFGTLGAPCLLLAAAAVAICSTAVGAEGLPAGTRTLANNPIALASGHGAVYSTYFVTDASSYGALVETQPRLGNGALATAATTASWAVLPAGKTALSAIHPDVPAAYETTGMSISGPMVVDAERSGGAYAAWWDDVATGRSALVRLKLGYSVDGAAPDGFIESTLTGVILVNVVTPKTTFLGSFRDAGVRAGPDGAVITPVGGAVDYVTYSPVKETTLVTSHAAQRWACTFVIAVAAGCLEFEGTSQTGARLSLPAGKRLNVFSLPSDEAVNVTVTPSVTEWTRCTTATSCTVKRMPAAGGRTTSMSLPSLESTDVYPVSEIFYWGRFANSTAGGGLYSVAASSSKPAHVIDAVLSPLAAANVSLASNRVSWIDNGAGGLAVLTRSVTGSTSISLGKTSLVAKGGYRPTDTAFGLALGASSTVLAYSSYAKQPTKHPLALMVQNGTKISLLSSSEEPDEYSNGPQVPISGSYVLYQTQKGWYLSNLATHNSTALKDSGVSAYALGGGYLAWVASTGAVSEERLGTTTVKAVHPPLSKGEVVSSAQLAVDGTTVAWVSNWCSSKTCGTDAEYVDSAVSSSPRTIPDTPNVSSPVLSGDYLGYEESVSGGDSLYVIKLRSTGQTPALVAANAYDLSLAGNYAAWISSATNIPYIGLL